MAWTNVPSDPYRHRWAASSPHLKSRRLNPYRPPSTAPPPYSGAFPHSVQGDHQTNYFSPRSFHESRTRSEVDYVPTPTNENVEFNQIDHPTWSTFSSPSPPVMTPDAAPFGFLDASDPITRVNDQVHMTTDMFPTNNPLFTDTFLVSSGVEFDSGMSMPFKAGVGLSHEFDSSEWGSNYFLFDEPMPPHDALSINCANISPAAQNANSASHHLSRSSPLPLLKPPVPPAKEQLPQTPSPDEDLNDSDATVVSVSTAFHPGSHPHLPHPDSIIVSADGTLFYVHSHILLAVAPHLFQYLLRGEAPSTIGAPSEAVQRYPHAGTSLCQVWLKMDLPADELNVVLHAFYDTSCAVHQPSIDTLEKAIDKMANVLGLSTKSIIAPSSKLLAHLLDCAPLHPLRIYTLGAQHSIHEIAVKASVHLLSFHLSSLTDEQATKMGAVYMTKLFRLHSQRAEQLRTLLLKPPHPHPPSATCGFEDQKVLETVWASVIVNLAWDVRPDISNAALHRALIPVVDQVDCLLCRSALESRIRDVLKSWANVERSIT